MTARPPFALPPALTAALTAALLACAACSPPQVEAPTNPGVCWRMVRDAKGQYRFNVVSQKAPNMETCAANLEALRLKFLAMGGTHDELSGAYQGNFLFLQRKGISTATRMDGTPYLFLMRTGDGRLAAPGAMPQAPQ